MPAPQSDTVTFKKFAGIRNTVSPERFGLEDLVSAVNFDIDETGRLKRRNGYSLAAAASGAHSLYANGELALYVQSTSLKRLATDYSATTLRTVTTGKKMSYTTVIGRTYFSNGTDTGVVENGSARTWGLVPPTSIGAAASTPGGLLPAGTYQWTVTYLRGDGQESGALMTGVVVLTEYAGVAFSALPVSSDPDAAYKIIYITPTNSEVLYEAAVVTNATTSTTYMGSGVEFARPLETWLCQQAPAGQCVSYFRGQTLVASGSGLYPSQPYAYELFDLRKYFDFESEITLLAPMENGLFVCTQTHHYWLPGLSPTDWAQQTKAEHGAILGSLVYTEGKNVGEGIPGLAALWLSREGVCVGANDGQFRVLSADRMNANISRASGASIVINDRVISTAE